MRSTFLMVPTMGEFMQFSFDFFSLTANVGKSFTLPSDLFQFPFFKPQDFQSFLHLPDLGFPVLWAVTLQMLGFFEQRYRFAFQVCCHVLIAVRSEFGSLSLHRLGFVSEFV